MRLMKRYKNPVLTFLSCMKSILRTITYISFLFKVQKEGLRGEKVSEIVSEGSKLY